MEEKIKKSIENEILDMNLILFKVEFVKENKNLFLRIILDSKTNVTLDDCEKVSKKIDKIIDKLNVIDESYILEVCSKGEDNE